LITPVDENGLAATHLLQTQSVDEAAHSRVGILVESLLQGIQATRGAGIDIRLKQDARVDNMVDPFIKIFEEQRDRFWEESSQVKYIHPTLRIGIIQSEFLDRVHGSHQIQVLNSDHPSPIKKNHLSKIMARFLKRIDLLHYYLLYQFETSGKGIPNPDIRRKSLIMWLIQSFIKPTDGLPIHGLVPIKSGRPSYDQLFKENSPDLFGPVQRKLTEIFSNAHTNTAKMKFKNERVFFVVTWYAQHFPNEIQDLITHLSGSALYKARKSSRKKPRIY
jgi:hypothetical protein